MKLSRARVIAANTPLAARDPVKRETRRLPASVVSAHAEAERILDAARRQATELKDDARAHREEAARFAGQEAREDEIARLAAVALHLEARERTYGEAELVRAVDLARLLAERVVGAELALSPERVGQMAAELLGSARGARTARILACREDAAALRETFAAVGLPLGTVTIEEDPTLLRGSLVLESDVGTLDGRLEVRLHRLSRALLEALGKS